MSSTEEQPTCDRHPRTRTIIDRLFVLNAERAEEEKRLGAAKPGKKAARSREPAPRPKKATAQAPPFDEGDK